jgi:hypothetical protein
MLLGEGELLGVLIVLFLQILEQHLFLIRVKLVQVDHHVIVVAFLLLKFLFFFFGFGPVFLLHLLFILNLEFLLPFLISPSIFNIVVPFLRLVNDILLNDKLLKLAHLLRVEVESHLLSRSDQIRVDWCVSLTNH